MVWVGFGYVANGLFIGGTLAGPAGGAGVSFRFPNSTQTYA